MDAMSAADPRPNVILPISHEIQAFCYRHVLKIIKEKGCGYQEAWDIFRGQMEKRLNAIGRDDHRGG